MAFAKGVSGNPKGRPRQTTEQKEARERFKGLLRAATVPALESVIAIAQDRHNKDRFNACRYIIDKAYGANTAFLLDGTEDGSPIVIEVRARRDDEEDWDAEWMAAPDPEVDDSQKYEEE